MSGRVGEWCLKVPYEEKPIRLQPSMIFVGRQECDILVNSTTVDKRHAVIYFNAADQQFHIKDLNTLSGTYVNGVRIPEQSYIKLEHKDQIRFGYHKQPYEIQLLPGFEEAHFRSLVSPTTPLEDDDSLNSLKQNTSPTKGTDSLEDVSPTVPALRVRELHKNHSVPTIDKSGSSSPTDRPPLRPDLPLTSKQTCMVSSYCAPVKSPSESLIDTRMICSLWDQNPKPPQRPPPPVTMTIPAEVHALPRSPKKVVENGESQRSQMAKAFVINFDEPKRRASVPQSVIQRREAQKATEDCRGSVSEDSNGTVNGNLSDSANFLIQKMLQSEQPDPANDGQEPEEDRRSEAGTYTVDDPQAREARRKIDQVFGVTDEAFNEYNTRGTPPANKTFFRNKPTPTRAQPIVAPPRRNRTTSNSTFLASSVPTGQGMMTESMMSSTISSGSSNGGLPSKPMVVRAKGPAPMRTTSASATNVKNRRPSSSGPVRASPSKPAVAKVNDGRPMTAKTPVASTLRRGTYGGSDFSLESSNSSGSHLTGSDSLKVNRAFALRRARLGLNEPVVSQKAHLLTGSNPNLFSRHDGGRFSMRLPSSRTRTRPGQDANINVLSAIDKSRMSPRNCRRNESDPCNLNMLGQESDEGDELARLGPQLRNVHPLSQSTFEPPTCEVPADGNMCRSASFNTPHAHPQDTRRGMASPLLQRKETFLKNSPIHSPLEESPQSVCSTPTRTTNCPSRPAFSPRLQRKPQSPLVSRKVIPSSQASPLKAKPPAGVAESFKEPKEPRNSLSALDTLVVQAISQLSGKLRLTARALIERESQRYPEGSDTLLMMQELLSSSSMPAQVTPGDTSKELSAILRNLRNLEQSINLLTALEPAPPIAEEVTPEEESQIEDEGQDAASLGDKVPRGFFTVSF